MKINLGCGRKNIDGFVGVDCLELPEVGIVHDLNVFLYPFKEDEITEVWMENVLEHLQNLRTFIH